MRIIVIFREDINLTEYGTLRLFLGRGVFNRNNNNIGRTILLLVDNGVFVVGAFTFETNVIKMISKFIFSEPFRAAWAVNFFGILESFHFARASHLVDIKFRLLPLFFLGGTTARLNTFKSIINA